MEVCLEGEGASSCDAFSWSAALEKILTYDNLEDVGLS